jgi:glycosyltransferase involved in cell wall biosynthesis
LKVAVYTDYAYSRRPDGVYAERAFALFLAELAARCERTVIIGRLRPDGGDSRYRLPDGVDFVPLPFYESLARPIGGIGAMLRSLRVFWRGIDDVDVCWLLGPHPLALGFAAIARLRRRRVVLGVRQDLSAYARSRHPGRRSFALAADLLERAYRLLGRRYPVVVVGPALRELYGGSPRLLEIAVSLVGDAEVSAAEDRPRSFGEPIRMLSVGRIDREKNPLLMAEVLAALQEAEPGRWRLVVCGEGPMSGELEQRLAELGVAEHAELRGYVQHGEDLRRAYAESDVLLHVSWTEGLPQVILEALAERLPVVATDVGGIGEAVGGATLLIPPGDPAAAIEALRTVAGDPALRERLMDAGSAYAHEHSTEAEISRLVSFMSPGTSGAAAAGVELPVGQGAGT